MKKHLLATATIAALAFTASPAFAKVTDSAPDFSFVEANFIKMDIDVPDEGVDLDADGVELKGAFEISDKAFMHFSYANPELDIADVGIDSYEVGVGAQHALSARTSVFGSVSYLRTEIDDFESYNGFGLNAGVKSRIASEIELTGTLSYGDLDLEDEVESDLGVDGLSASVDMRYFFTNEFAVGISYQLSEDTDTLSVGARYSF
tara:strand:- start:486 stop:1100 length:615 start_codon:yes stop_codon:yes gene_type:complete